MGARGPAGREFLPAIKGTAHRGTVTAVAKTSMGIIAFCVGGNCLPGTSVCPDFGAL